MIVKTSLRSRVIHAATWTMGGHIFSQALRLASNLVMTRLLVPEMFGIMAIANVIMVGLVMMSDFGVRQNIIQSTRSENKNFLNTAWTVQIIKGAVLWVIALIISFAVMLVADKNWWPTDSVYADPMLPYVIAAISFTVVINGMVPTKLAIAHRNLAINMAVKIGLLSQVTGIFVMIVWAYIDRSIWALVIGAIMASIMKVFFSYVLLAGENNKLHIDKESLHEIFHFGKWIFLTSILGFLAMNGDKLILGGLIDTKLLGLYTIAIFIVGAVQQIFGKIIGSVVLPALSEVVRNRQDDLKKTYYKFRFPVDVITLFAAGFIFMTGSFIIDILYDDRYQAAGYFLEVLSLSLLAERYSLAGQCFVAMGKPSYIVPIITIRVLVLYALLPISYNYLGLDGALWVIALNRLVTLPILFYIKIKNSLFDIFKELYVLPFFILGLTVGWVLNCFVTLNG